jgi:uncharacterized protein (UPF0335 family)
MRNLEAKLLEIATRISRLYSDVELIREEILQIVKDLKSEGDKNK